VAVVFVATDEVGTVTVPVVEPAAITNDAGGTIEATFEDSVTVAPPAGAGSVRVTIAEPLLPPTTAVGLKTTELTPGGVIVRAAVAVVPYSKASMFEVVLEATLTVVTVAVPVELPAGTVIDAGIVAADVLLDSRTTDWPPAGAGPVNVTVATEVVPPVTVLGANEIPWTPTGFRVRTTEAVDVSGAVAVKVTPVLVDTVVVAMLITPDVVAPAATVTDEGIVPAALLEDRATT